MASKFGHHYQPGWDFVVEVNAIAGLAADPKADRAALRDRVARAMEFDVGGKPEAIAAKHTLRLIERQISGVPEIGPESERLVRDFADALRAKLAAAEAKYGWRDDWKFDDWEADCRAQMRKHIGKGDPLDVAIYCAFLWSRGWSTAPAAPDLPNDDLLAATVSCSGTEITIQCDDHDVKDRLMDFLTGGTRATPAPENETVG